mmetsp:Transcript_17737/g.49107  ORF Transcript_17737/g.49107 Transcript_17737/m.49107 type:complete len:286 (+) Transcript_17737:1594-2451(+)
MRSATSPWHFALGKERIPFAFNNILNTYTALSLASKAVCQNCLRPLGTIMLAMRSQDRYKNPHDANSHCKMLNLIFGFIVLGCFWNVWAAAPPSITTAERSNENYWSNNTGDHLDTTPSMQSREQSEWLEEMKAITLIPYELASMESHNVIDNSGLKVLFSGMKVSDGSIRNITNKVGWHHSSWSDQRGLSTPESQKSNHRFRWENLFFTIVGSGTLLVGRILSKKALNRRDRWKRLSKADPLAYDYDLVHTLSVPDEDSWKSYGSFDSASSSDWSGDCFDRFDV